MIETRAKTTFITLPETLARPIDGGCQCPYCKSHPNHVPAWDVLASDGKKSWTVHYPELKNRKAA